LHEPREPFTEVTPETRPAAAPSTTPSPSEPSVTRRA